MAPLSRKRHLLVTLGPTREFIDPIRFITNRATGTLGYFIAREALRRGYRVTCVAGPTALAPLPGTRWVNVVGAEEMRRAVIAALPRTDALVMSAAVSDYGAAHPSPTKRKRLGRQFSLPLKAHPDILKEAAGMRGRQVLVGFALETEALLKRASRKLKDKGADLMIANLARPEGHPFGERAVDVTFLWRDGRRESYRKISKKHLAKVVLEAVEALIQARAVTKAAETHRAR